MTVADLRTELRSVPLPRPWGADVPFNHVIVTHVTLADGRTGSGFSWTPQIGAHAVKALLDHDLREALIGLDPHPEVVWDRLWRHLREAGPGGVTTVALAGVDLALWDLRCRERDLADVLGRRRDEVPVYGSGVNLHYPLEELVAQARRWVAAGHRGVKIKVGRPDLAEDVARVAAVREVIGPDRLLMIDANQRWDLHRARRALAALREFDLHWIEEPLPADDVAAHVELRRCTDVPVAVGENVYTTYGFRDLLAAGACDVVQPNVARVGGITPFLRIVELARTYDVPVHPHLLSEMSGQLALALPLPAMVEDVEDASFAALGLLDEPYPVEVSGGVLRAGPHAGLGLRWS
ncbi:mandelate racemase/muconate lactonizing enzyme family protein [Nonomuraea sp. KC401]|uniref:Mandelate racemase/muconate lactonizing enzyme family protein n=1 Tax=Nonomuraea longispora TaxID=1848320 RepID=A0A4V2XLI3_9ACTN|nr:MULTISPECIES: mandelate racemase/muconate lactonizing enzyme family protein [Nonomuraea]NBE93344.1 mandelate racemase/muconate lactonizing enzyme family protein [Nonomuraea sp. K271]TDC10556.1 mandelate racemase/muconate lactonizing enzyme family protein [Nonomuraea longispora]TLF73469.1 mandelate racemase/muconate lactonizing enzyme family protein [Nonomuraea sp. KC401]